MVRITLSAFDRRRRGDGRSPHRGNDQDSSDLAQLSSLALERAWNNIERMPASGELEFLERRVVAHRNKLHFALREAIREQTPNGRYVLHGYSTSMRRHLEYVDSSRRDLLRGLGGTVFNIFPSTTTEVVPDDHRNPSPLPRDAPTVVPGQPQAVPFEGITRFFINNGFLIPKAWEPRLPYGSRLALPRGVVDETHIGLNPKALLGSWRNNLATYWEDSLLMGNSNARHAIRQTNFAFLIDKYRWYDNGWEPAAGDVVHLDTWVEQRARDGLIIYRIDGKEEFEKIFGFEWPATDNNITDPLEWSWTNRIPEELNNRLSSLLSRSMRSGLKILFSFLGSTVRLAK